MSIKTTIQTSFSRVKKDIESMKNWANDWFGFLENNQHNLAVRIDELERKIEDLEKRKIRIV